MSGNFNWVGSFNECRNVTVPVLKNTTQGGFKGQYCQLSINLLPDSYNFPVKVGTCLPNTCDSSNLITVLNTIMHKEEFQSFFSESFVSTSKTVELKCFPESREFSYGTIVYFSVVLVVAACCLIGTTITLCSRQPIKEKDCCDLKEMSVPKTNNIEMSSLPNIENNGDSINGTSEDSTISSSNSEGECVVTNEVGCVEDVPQVEEDKQANTLLPNTVKIVFSYKSLRKIVICIYSSEDSSISGSNSEGECSVTNEVRCVEDVPQVVENKQANTLLPNTVKIAFSYKILGNVIISIYSSEDSAISDSNSEAECSVTNEVRCVQDVSQVEEEKKGVKNFLKKFFLCFCLITNEEKMQLTAQSQRTVLIGLRFFCAAWVLLCHTFSSSFNVVGNPVEALSMADNLWYQVILNGFYSVDIFFVLSGYFIAKSVLELAPERLNVKFIPIMIFRRLIRLVPQYAFMIFFFVTCFPHLASGPFWPHNAGTCQDNWWMNLLFVNNLFTDGAQCMPWTWYMPCDFQYFVVSLVVLYVLVRCPKLGKTLIFGLFCGSFAYGFYVTYENNLFTGPANNLDLAARNPGVFMMDFFKYFQKIYIHPLARYNVYLVGMLLAYYMHKKTGKNIFETNKVASYAMDAATLAVALLCIFGLHLFGKDISLIGACFYNSLHHLLFSLCVAWFLFKCETGQAGILGRILSCKAFVSMGTVSYAVYLWHPIVMDAFYLSQRSTIVYTHFMLVRRSLLWIGSPVISSCQSSLTML
ncbi:nose resistant to fluoxetine protein 6 [Caerostris darwini]|uniref:Nose resistant to fluoxetine protein 6 n=1 Tax=Caerostris darwini TaxID=1538125 RepID=A0AAV4VWZ4_9ARAC|nr:nose resistant to fluoxetine protein 6 [Caerostris darwini]